VSSIKIDLDVLDPVLTKVDELVESLNGVNLYTGDDPSARAERKLAAQTGRDLLYLADQFELASQFVRQQYWLSRGYEG